MATKVNYNHFTVGSDSLAPRQRRLLRLLKERGTWSNLSPYHDKHEYATMMALQLRGFVRVQYDRDLGGYVAQLTPAGAAR